ncbi:hypothetical protein K503DRAFT_768306, partial [Rhizopogon vinicolor AM-OR11-026]
SDNQSDNNKHRNSTHGRALTPLNFYVALLRSRGQDNIRLLRDFNEKLLMTHPCEYLRIEDERLVRLDNETEMWWKEKMRYDNSDSQHSMQCTRTVYMEYITDNQPSGSMY